MKNDKIELTNEELEELKDEIRFRTKVYLQLKQLNSIPHKVWTLEATTNIHSLLLIGILLVIVGIAFRMWAG